MNIGKLTYAGKNSLTDLGVYVTGSGTHNAAERDTTTFSIAGRNGDLIVDNGRYKNIQVIYPAFIPHAFSGEEQKVRNWLRTGAVYGKIEDTYDTTHFRLGRPVGELTFEPVRPNGANFQITFDCDPRRFLVSGEDEVTVTPSTQSLSGAVVEFETPAATSMDKAEVTLIPVQSGTGNPSPTNVRPISGTSDVTVNVTGKNLFSASFTSGKNIDSSGEIVDNVSRCATLDFIRIKPSTAYTLSYTGEGSNGIAYYDENYTFISILTWAVQPRTFTTPSNAKYVRFSYNKSTAPTKVQLEYGSTATNYDPTIPATVSVELSKNKFTDFFKIGKNISSGTVVDRPANDRCATVDGCAVLAETQYTISFSGGGDVGVYYYDATDTFISQATGWQALPFTFTTPQNTARVRFSYNTGTPPTDVQLELGATATTYTAAIIYGGTYDFVTGKLIVTWKGVRGSDLTWIWLASGTGNPPWAYAETTDKAYGQSNFYCSAYRVVDKFFRDLITGETSGHETNRNIIVKDDAWTSLSDAEADLASVQFVYELDTPIEFTLTPQQVQTLVGENNVWSNSGDVSIEFAEPFSITNTTPFTAKPLFKITNPAQNDVLSVNGESVTFTSAYTGEVFIDCETMNAYSGANNLNGIVSVTDFPELEEGLNAVSWSGSGDCKLIPRWWEL